MHLLLCCRHVALRYRDVGNKVVPYIVLPKGCQALFAFLFAVHLAPIKGGRILQTFLYVRSSLNDNQYAHPIDLLPIVDLGTKKVVKCEMYDEPAKIPPEDINYHREFLANKWRVGLKPLEVV